MQQTVAHELAHAWYGDTVTPDDWSDLWMNEGMAMYVEAAVLHRPRLALRGLLGPASSPAATPCGASSTARLATTTATSSRRSTSTTAPPGCGAGYARRSVPPRFDELARRWPQEHRNTVQDRASFVAWLSANTGRDLTPFFDEWLDSPTPPA